MKPTGIARRVDQLGRIVLPKELRRTYKLDIGDGVEIFMDGDMVVLKKHEPSCVFCGESGEFSYHMEKKVCSECLGDIKK